MHQLLKRDIDKLNVIEQVVDAGVLLQHARLPPEPAGGGVGVFEHFFEGFTIIEKSLRKFFNLFFFRLDRTQAVPFFVVLFFILFEICDGNSFR